MCEFPFSLCTVSLTVVLLICRLGDATAPKRNLPRFCLGFFILTQDIFSRCRDKCREFHLPLGWARKAHPQVDEKGTGSSAPSLLLLAIAPKHGKHIIFTHVTHKHDKHGIFDMLNKSHFATITPQEQNFPFLMLLGTLSLHKSTAGLFVSQEFQS